MAIRRRPQSKKTTKKRPKKSTGFSFPFKKALAAVALLLLTAALIYWFQPFSRFAGVNPEAVESVLIAAGVNLDTQRQIRIRDGVERWKIQLPTMAKKKAVLAALKRMVRSEGGRWQEGDDSWYKGQNIHILALHQTGDRPFRLILVVNDPQKEQSPKKNLSKKQGDGDVQTVVPTKKETVRPAQPEVVDHRDGQRRIALILDDIGYKKAAYLKPVLELKFPVTFAVLPFLPHSVENAVYFHQNHYEVMLHMPMEPDDYPRINPGEGAILTGQTEAEIQIALDRALRDVPFVKGVNNHMGSRITANRTLMHSVLSELKNRDLFYIDSRTQSNTIGYALAKNMGMRTAKRHVFLDAEESYEFAKKQLIQAKHLADKQGVAIVIGHPYPTSLQALIEFMPAMDREGYRFVFASEVVTSHPEHL